MKKKLVLTFFILLIFSVVNLNAENIKINFIQENGNKIEKEYDSSKGPLVLFDTESMKTVSIENLGVFKSVKILELQQLSFLESLDFLDMFPNLEELYIGYGVKYSTVNLKNLKKLKLVELSDKKIILK